MNKKLKKILITPGSNIRKSMSLIKNNGLKGLIVVDKNNNLLGTLTDGDLRKFILKNNNLNESIDKIYNKKSKYVTDKTFSGKKIKLLIEKYKIPFLPVIDKNNKVVNFITNEKIKKIKRKISYNLNNIPVVIMAGGLGKRLFPFTNILPKALMPIKNKTVIEVIIEKFFNFGINNFILSINFKSEIIKAFFKEKKPDYKISFIEEKKPLGTIGSLSQLKKNKYKNLFLVNCDTIAKVDYSKVVKFHLKNNNDITVLAIDKNSTIPYGVINLNNQNKFKNIEEKPKYKYLANAGLYMIKSSLINKIPKNKFLHATDFIKKLSKSINIGIYRIKESQWMDVGQWEEFEKTIKKFK